MFVLKLPRFFTRLYGEQKSAAISNLKYIWTSSSRSYKVLALEIFSIKLLDLRIIYLTFVHLDQRPIGRCGPRAPKQQRQSGTQRPFGR